MAAATRSAGAWMCLAGGGLFLLALWLPSIDTDFGELLRGFGTRGYQCALGLVFMLTTVTTAPLALPLWLALLAGNLWAVAAPLFVMFHRAPRRVFARARWVALTAVVGVLVLGVFSEPMGFPVLHVGFFVWAASLVLVCLGSWSLAHQ